METSVSLLSLNANDSIDFKPSSNLTLVNPEFWKAESLMMNSTSDLGKVTVFILIF